MITSYPDYCNTFLIAFLPALLCLSSSCPTIMHLLPSSKYSFKKCISHSSYLLKTIQWLSITFRIKKKKKKSLLDLKREKESPWLLVLPHLLSFTSFHSSQVMHSRQVAVLEPLYLLPSLPAMLCSSIFVNMASPCPEDTGFKKSPFRKTFTDYPILK